MKIIDLLNKIAKGEKVPKHIKYLNLIREYDDEMKDYINDDTYLIYNLNAFGLNDEIEIIEEEEKIEKIDISKFPKRNNSLKKTARKLNEIIDYINSKENNNE